jgi:hypothetical protein
MGTDCYGIAFGALVDEALVEAHNPVRVEGRQQQFVAPGDDGDLGPAVGEGLAVGGGDELHIAEHAHAQAFGVDILELSEERVAVRAAPDERDDIAVFQVVNPIPGAGLLAVDTGREG